VVVVAVVDRPTAAAFVVAVVAVVLIYLGNVLVELVELVRVVTTAGTGDREEGEDPVIITVPMRLIQQQLRSVVLAIIPILEGRLVVVPDLAMVEKLVAAAAG
jgi:hypothetical protein